MSCSLFQKEDDPPINPRDYTFRIDTLYSPDGFQNTITRLWGSSSNDIYSSSNCSTTKGTLWHFDGDEWIPVVLARSIGGNILSWHKVRDIHGFSSDNIWAVGVQSNNDIWNPNDTSMIIHFDGEEWNQTDQLLIRGLEVIYGVNENDIWAGGFYGYLYHYDGNEWTPDTIPVPEAHDTSNWSNFLAIEGNAENNYYALYNKNEWLSVLLHFNGVDWEILDEFGRFDHERIWMSPNGSLYSCGFGHIDKWENDAWSRIFETETYFYSITGTSDSSIFVAGKSDDNSYSSLFHYNGEDWYEYDSIELPTSILGFVWSDINKLVLSIATIDGSTIKSIIYQGS
ncbi:MAG: hypothetical protein HOB40_06820 [Candidatus Marinimicrobia bacterium]|jgi:hypothetical protein|nr:hypothetical protein [Candidatus Neomarinimicrobiota bacterium]MBT4282203.1 hypothetical protein [Candidatus Neomarinimicrobiota bacterium]MBT4580128.1 hypothetical protein [Candidatus Neomarinimicrobiota bacterium]MBT5461677.1 hypothetical protein [Candidatus Neomarinimicrobiota bacterium]MBT5759019.1 hypothetical protein [Candidatus Neomarinimicrobiota bacterium]